MKSFLKNEFSEHIRIAEETIIVSEKLIKDAANLCIASINEGNKILLFGNGGSAADAQHIAAELVGRYKNPRKGLPAIAITTDTSSITSISNDFGYLYVFARQVEALAKRGDVLIGISTGGSSENVLEALSSGKELGCQTIGLSGKDGGKFNSICDVNIIVPSFDTPRIQEMHILIGHCICDLVDQKFNNFEK